MNQCRLSATFRPAPEISNHVTQIMDPSAGQWESRSCERLVKLGLWCCMHVPEQRPAIATVLGELVKMVNGLAASGVLHDEKNDM